MELMRRALDALLRAGLGGTIQMNQRAIDSAVGILRSALEQAEPVVWDPQCPLCGGSRPAALAQQAEPVVEPKEAT
jgi:hypothetical protein